MRSRKRKRIAVLAGIAAFLCFYIGAAYLYFHFEAPEKASLTNAVWYVLLNPTRFGFGSLMPSTIAGRLVGLTFVLANIGLIGLVIGKAAQLFGDFREARRRGHHGTKFENHYIIYGWDDFGQKVAEQLVRARRQVVIVTDKRETVEHIYDHFSTAETRHQRVGKNVFVLHADYKNFDLLRHANVERAMRVFINTGTGTDALIAMLNMKERYPDVRAVARIGNEELIDTFIEAGFERVITNWTASAKLTASYIFEPDVAEVALDLMATARDEHDFEAQQYEVTRHSGLVGREYGEVFEQFYFERGVACLGLSRRTGDGRRELLTLPPDDVVLTEGDFLLVMLNGTHVDEMQRRFGVRGDGVWTR